MTRLPKHFLTLGVLVVLACVLADTRVNAQGDDLINAADKGELSRVKALLDAKADVNAKTGDGVTALILASQNGHLEVVRVLLDEAKADVNAKTGDGGTALIQASLNGHEGVVRALLEAKADVNGKRADGFTALILASQNGHLEVVRALLDAKADVNAKGGNGVTALMVASEGAQLDVVRTLLEAKADVNAKAGNGGTALMVASQNGHLGVVRALLEAKADVSAKAGDGVTTALTLASMNGHLEVAQLLNSAGAQSRPDDNSAAAPTKKTPAPAPAPTPAGATKVNAKDGLTYVWIPAGKFKMGCSPGDKQCNPYDEEPQEATVSKGFWMGQTPVTQTAYQRVIGSNPSHFHGDQLPVETVSWDGATAYCSAAGMRLPTEAEWEYAARAGSTAFRYGDLDAIAWYSQNSGNSTKPVGQKQPNAWKLYDLLGNVREWTADWYAGGRAGPFRAVRGGSWQSLSPDLRVSHFSGSSPGVAMGDLGFRCVGE